MEIAQEELFDRADSIDLKKSVEDVKKILRLMHKKNERVDLTLLLARENEGKKRVTLTRWLAAVIEKRIDITQNLENLTPNLYDASEVTSAMQKEIRRGNAIHACWWARELLLSPGYRGMEYCWRRLRVISVEDIGNVNLAKFVDELYRKASSVGFLGREGICFALKATFYLSKTPAKARFFDELCEYNLLLSEGKIKIKKPECETVGESVLMAMKRNIKEGKWFHACWFARDLLTCDSRKSEDKFWEDVVEISKEFKSDVSFLYEQAKEFSNQKQGLGAWDSQRCAMMAVFSLSQKIQVRENVDDAINGIGDFNFEETEKELEILKEDHVQIPDYAKDGHILSGIKMGRTMSSVTGQRFWYMVSSRINNKVSPIGDEKGKIMLLHLQKANNLCLTSEEFEESYRSL